MKTFMEVAVTVEYVHYADDLLIAILRVGDSISLSTWFQQIIQES